MPDGDSCSSRPACRRGSPGRGSRRDRPAVRRSSRPLAVSQIDTRGASRSPTHSSRPPRVSASPSGLPPMVRSRSFFASLQIEHAHRPRRDVRGVRRAVVGRDDDHVRALLPRRDRASARAVGCDHRDRVAALGRRDQPPVGQPQQSVRSLVGAEVDRPDSWHGRRRRTRRSSCCHRTTTAACRPSGETAISCGILPVGSRASSSPEPSAMMLSVSSPLFPTSNVSAAGGPASMRAQKGAQRNDGA